MLVVPQLNQAYQQHLTVDSLNWSQLSLFGPLRFWTTGANKNIFLEQELHRSSGCKPAKGVRFCAQIHLCIVLNEDSNQTTSLASAASLCSFGKLINSSIEDGVRQRGGDGWRGQAAQLHSQRIQDRKGNSLHNASP